jgi:hypothetical protein
MFTRVNGRPRGLECLMRWVGYQEQSWEPLVNVKKSEQFHTYARGNGLIRFIPTAYRVEVRQGVPQGMIGEEENGPRGG